MTSAEKKPGNEVSVPAPVPAPPPPPPSPPPGNEVSVPVPPSPRLFGKAEEKQMLSPWPVREPPDYLKWLNHSQGKEEIAEIRQAIKRSRPYGSENWTAKAVRQFGLESTTRSRGRPPKGS